jgi:hypothetical protein
MNNSSSTSEVFQHIGEANIFLQLCLVLPEYVCLLLLIIGIYTMFHGIEIIHPLYTALFLNLLVSSLSTVINIAAFSLVSIEKYVKVTNLSNSISTHFHCTSWCITSIIRYIYIFHNDWIHNVIPSAKLKCSLAVVLSFVLSFLQSAPAFAVVILFGENAISLEKNDFFVRQYPFVMCLFLFLFLSLTIKGRSNLT